MVNEKLLQCIELYSVDLGESFPNQHLTIFDCNRCRYSRERAFETQSAFIRPCQRSSRGAARAGLLRLTTAEPPARDFFRAAAGAAPSPPSQRITPFREPRVSLPRARDATRPWHIATFSLSPARFLPCGFGDLHTQSTLRAPYLLLNFLRIWHHMT